MAQERRARWKKFGEAASERATDSVTSQTPDEVLLERIARQKQTQEEKSKAADFRTAMAGSDKSAIVGSLRDMLYKKRMERQLLAAKGLIAAPERPPDEVGVAEGEDEMWGVGCGQTQAWEGRGVAGGLAGCADGCAADGAGLAAGGPCMPLDNQRPGSRSVP